MGVADVDAAASRLFIGSTGLAIGMLPVVLLVGFVLVAVQGWGLPGFIGLALVVGLFAAAGAGGNRSLP